MTELEQAIKDEYGTDPHLGEPHPDTIGAIANLVRSMIRVSKKRPAQYKNEPWIQLTADNHIEHAYQHARRVWFWSEEQGIIQEHTDTDGELHSSHAALRLAFYEARLGR